MRVCRWVIAALVVLPRAATASSAVEYPDNGPAQLSRGGAWLATASDPIAGYYNPAALATQPSSVGLGLNVAMQKICFTRRGPGGAEIGPSPGLEATGATYTEACNTERANVVPSLAGVWRVSEKLGVGLTITPPSSYGRVLWPDLVSTDARQAPIPAPQRYLSLEVQGTILWPTLSFGYSITEDVHVGAGFVAGIALLRLQSMSMGNVQQTNPRDEFINDSKSLVEAKDLFVPGGVASVLVELSENLDVAAWFRASDAIRAKGDLEVVAGYYTQGGVRSTQCTTAGQADCAQTTRSKEQVGDDGASVTLSIPMELRVGARWHVPRAAASGLAREKQRVDPHATRDPLRDDLYDLELDLTWANNSAADVAKIRFAEGINVLGAAGTVPTNADRPTGYRDSYGARLGGQWNALRDRAALRLGTWVETSAVPDDHLTVTGVPALRGGIAGGLVFRVARTDLELGYMRAWNAGLDNGGDGKLKAIAGSGSDDNRSYHAVNGGKVKQSAHVFSLGGIVRF